MAGPDEPEGEVRGGGAVTSAGKVAPQTTVTCQQDCQRSSLLIAMGYVHWTAYCPNCSTQHFMFICPLPLP